MQTFEEEQNVTKINGIKIDVRAKNCLYVTIGDWIIYMDNSTGERIIDSWTDLESNQIIVTKHKTVK